MQGLRLSRGGRVPRGAAALLLAGALFGMAGTARAVPATSQPFVPARVASVAQELRAYAQVEPIATVELRVVGPGTLDALRILPGSAVRAGEVLARVQGPRMQARLVASAQQLASAEARARAARRLLGIVRAKFGAQLATRQQLDAAQSGLSAAEAAVRTATARLREVRSQQFLRAPAAGTILALQAADGEQVASGQAIATLQPAGRLWLRAEVYGAQASGLRVGMRGSFRPAGGQAGPVAVKVASIAAALAPDGGVQLGLLPVASRVPADWIDGQWGKVLLEGPVRRMVMVPTRALILDRGHWWVLVHTAAGDRPTRVVPGPARGWQTGIVSGLSPGQQVVVTDAFLEYHRGIASRYTPPD